MSYVTYAVLDPDRPGQFQSPFCSFLFQPVYIGKGTVKRARNINLYLTGRGKPHSGKLLNEWLNQRIGTEVPVVIMEAEDELLALQRESILTIHFGLAHLGGILLNGCHGGACANSRPTEKTKELLSILNKGSNNPNWGKPWTEERHKKWAKTWYSQPRTRSAESMKNLWDAYRKKYEIIDNKGNIFTTENLTDFCAHHKLPLSALRAALKDDGIVKRKNEKRAASRVDGWKIQYIQKS